MSNKGSMEVFKHVGFRIVDGGDVLLDRDSFDWLIEQAEKAEKYRGILEWYAHPDTYNRAGNNVVVVMMDRGWNAREVLKE